MYAIINRTTKVTLFYNTFSAACNACAAYDVLPGHSVYIVDFTQSKIEQL